MQDAKRFQALPYHISYRNCLEERIAGSNILTVKIDGAEFSDRKPAIHHQEAAYIQAQMAFGGIRLPGPEPELFRGQLEKSNDAIII